MKVKLSEFNRGSNIFFSYEWLPAFQDESMDSLIKRVTESSKEFQPMFCAVSWHDNSSISITENSSLKFAVNLHRHGLTVLLHLCCRDLTKDDAFQILKEMKNYGIRNIFALKGDHRENSKSCFPYAKDLVQFIREKFGSYFTICVAGYPSGHPDNYENKLEDLKYLKEKVDAGADFIITQIIFDGSEYCDFVKNCRSIGIQVPIIPGILPIKNIILTERIIRNCRVAVPNSIQNKLLQFKDDPVALENYSIQNATDIIKSIQNSGIDVPGVHFFTLNSPEICLEVKKKICNSFESSTG